MTALLVPPRDCSFTAEDWQVLARCWYPVAFASDLGAAPIAVRLLDERLVVYRAGPQMVLSIGWVEGEELVCRYHGLRFGPDGRCRLIPSEPDAIPTARMRLATFPVLERYGLIWTSLDPHADPAALPRFPLWDDPDYERILPPSIDIAGSAGRQCEGFLDVAHFAWVHHESFAHRDNPLVPAYAVRWTKAGTLVADCISDVANIPHGTLPARPVPDGFLWRRLYEVQFPFFPTLTIFFPEDGVLSLLNCASPVSARGTRLFVPIARNFDKGAYLDPVHAFNLRIFEEDRLIVESQHPEDLPLDLASEAHIRADRASIAYRQGLRRMGLGRTYTS